jgi:hypothetical protein
VYLNSRYQDINGYQITIVGCHHYHKLKKSAGMVKSGFGFHNNIKLPTITPDSLFTVVTTINGFDYLVMWYWYRPLEWQFGGCCWWISGVKCYNLIMVHFGASNNAGICVVKSKVFNTIVGRWICFTYLINFRCNNPTFGDGFTCKAYTY